MRRSIALVAGAVVIYHVPVYVLGITDMSNFDVRLITTSKACVLLVNAVADECAKLAAYAHFDAFGRRANALERLGFLEGSMAKTNNMRELGSAAPEIAAAHGSFVQVVRKGDREYIASGEAFLDQAKRPAHLVIAYQTRDGREKAFAVTRLPDYRDVVSAAAAIAMRGGRSRSQRTICRGSSSQRLGDRRVYWKRPSTFRHALDLQRCCARQNEIAMIHPQQEQSVTVFFPAFNDAGSIQSLVETSLSVLATLTDDYEVLVINDGSTDATASIIDTLAARHPSVKAIHHANNTGYGGALRSGFRNATKDLVFYTDGDAQYDVRELSKLYPMMVPGVDIVNGYKIKRADSAVRKLVGWCYQRTARALFRLPIRDVDCDFRLIRRSAVQSLELSSSSGAICVELVHKLHAAGYVFVEAPVHHYARVHGHSQFFRFGRIVRTAVDFYRLWLRRSVSGGSQRKEGETRVTSGTTAARRVDAE